MNIACSHSVADFLKEVKANDALGWQEIQSAITLLDDHNTVEDGIIETDTLIICFYTNGDRIILTNVCFKTDESVFAIADLQVFAQENLASFAESGRVLSDGVRELGSQFAAIVDSAFHNMVTDFVAISNAKSLQEAMGLQAQLGRAAFERMITDSNKMAEGTFSLLERMLEPISALVTNKD